MKEKQGYQQLEGNWYTPTQEEARNELETFVKNMISPFFYETHRDGEHIRRLSSFGIIFDNTQLQNSLGSLIRFTASIEAEEAKLAGFTSRQELLDTSLGWIADVWAFEICQNPGKEYLKFRLPPDNKIAQKKYQSEAKDNLTTMTEIYISLSDQTNKSHLRSELSEGL